MSAVQKLQGVGISALLERVSDDAAVDYDHPGAGEALIAIEPGPYQADMAYTSMEEYAAWQIVNAATYSTSCDSKTMTIQSHDANAVVARRILELAGYKNLASVINVENAVVESMSSAQLINFIEEHREAINTCTLEVAQ